ncbi:putative T6SS immunity periplasmic lipoprotein [Yersinia rohdei]|uniref:putative T6SS immunity periplasmic lipoprotein n=1 Tax=Yersinia rohdei TaxID=29485 RepID=UPI0011A3CE69|nr:putative T6SS immunity periplasmic lipoprotein [Yersinia rohdei]
MKTTILMFIFMLSGCLGDRIPWDIAEVKQSNGAVCIYSSEIGENFVFERLKIQKTGESKEFIANFTDKIYAKNRCLPMMDYQFVTNGEYNISFSVIDTYSGKRKVYAARFLDK